MTLSNDRKRTIKQDMVSQIWNAYEYPEVMEDYTDEDREYVRELAVRIERLLGI